MLLDHILLGLARKKKKNLKVPVLQASLVASSEPVLKLNHSPLEQAAPVGRFGIFSGSPYKAGPGHVGTCVAGFLQEHRIDSGSHRQDGWGTHSLLSLLLLNCGSIFVGVALSLKRTTDSQSLSKCYWETLANREIRVFCAGTGIGQQRQIISVMGWFWVICSDMLCRFHQKVGKEKQMWVGMPEDLGTDTIASVSFVHPSSTWWEQQFHGDYQENIPPCLS